MTETKIKTKRENCDALVGCISSKEVVSLTKMDRLEMSKPTTGFLSLLKKLRGSSKSGKPASGKRQMSILRRLPKILKFIPGKAQDVRSYFLTMLLSYYFWNRTLNTQVSKDAKSLLKFEI